MEYLSIFCIRIFSARCIHSYVGIIHIRFPGRNLQFPLSLLDTQAPLFFSIPIILRISQNARHTAFYRFPPLTFPLTFSWDLQEPGTVFHTEFSLKKRNICAIIKSSGL